MNNMAITHDMIKLHLLVKNLMIFEATKVENQEKTKAKEIWNQMKFTKKPLLTQKERQLGAIDLTR